MKTRIEIAAAKRALRNEMGWHWGGNHTRNWHGLPQGILGIGFGVKRTQGKAAAQDCIRIYVKQKRPKSKLTMKQRIKKDIAGYPTDVIAVGVIRPHQGPGGSISNAQGIGGTLGCIVHDGSGSYLLGSWHVLTNTYGQDGDPIYMPSRSIDGGAPQVASLIATPHFHLNGGENAFDASVAQIEPGMAIDPPIDGLGPIVLPPVPAMQSAPVVKQGAATQRTTGVVEGISEDVPVYYNGDPTQKAILTGQIAIVGDGGQFSDEGDSGALVCTSDLHPMGLIAGASPGTDVVKTPHSFASPIQVILDCYQVSITV
jgi:hypothetical protein